MPLLHCRVITNHVGVKQFIPRGIEGDKSSTLINDDVVVFNVFPDGSKVDMRANPPFFSIMPCPHCGTDNDRKHNALLHVDKKAGLDESLVQAFAKANNCTTHHAFMFLKFDDKRFPGPIQRVSMEPDTLSQIKINEQPIVPLVDISIEEVEQFKKTA